MPTTNFGLSGIEVSKDTVDFFFWADNENVTNSNKRKELNNLVMSRVVYDTKVSKTLKL
jgi:hypothetical protein